MSVQAPTTEKGDKCLVMAEDFACSLTPDQVEKGKSEAESILFTSGETVAVIPNDDDGKVESPDKKT